jgi:acyl dehydratase
MATRAHSTIPATHKLPDGIAGDVVRDLDVGPLATCRLTITDEDVERWTAIHDDRYPWYEDAGARARGASSAPPYILYYASQNLLRPIRHFERRPGEGGGLARYEAEFLGPLPVGRELEISGAVLDKFRRRSTVRLTWETEARCEGRLLQRHRKTWARRIPPEEAASLPERPSDGRPPEAPADAESFGPIRYLVSQERMSAFEGPGEVNAHTDVDLARRSGEPGPRAQGALSFGLLSRLMSDRFGRAFSSSGRLDVRFVASVHAGEPLEARGAIVRSSNLSVVSRVWTENSRSELTAVGTGEARQG